MKKSRAPVSVGDTATNLLLRKQQSMARAALALAEYDGSSIARPKTGGFTLHARSRSAFDDGSPPREKDNAGATSTN